MLQTLFPQRIDYMVRTLSSYLASEWLSHACAVLYLHILYCVAGLLELGPLATEILSASDRVC